MTSELDGYKKRCLELEKKSKNDEKRCLMLEVEVEDLKNKNEELERKLMKIWEVVEVRDEEQKAESEVYKLKEKVNELMSPVYELESDMNEKAKQDINVVSSFSSKVRKRLSFEADRSSSKKMAPSTPGVAQTPFFCVIDINNENVNYDETLENKNISYSSNHIAFDKTNLEDVDEEDVDGLKFHCSNSRGAKRKRVAKNKQDTSGVDQNKIVSLQGNTSSEDEEANDGAEGSESEEESLSDYKETRENVRRKTVSNYKWDSRREMQDAFGEDPELCMSAVCALYRQQTEDEKAFKETRYRNGRGFNQDDAQRGSELAEFLMDGDPAGDLKKSVEDLKQFDKKGIEDCRRIALYYSRQLFEIYYNNEDPCFP
ncbi:hypothetical protein CTI12_AA246440 [Artemisia annua]|uniref:Uncharacterized protein n=1 Tax=Artemisia annua TaxID=35608 RepID=A0A2U1NNK3_ARTAN|nr:hypothetical protein CTI12_AA246440 [Artemisia annua]